MNLRKQYDLVVYFGRFEPFHTAHLRTIEKAERHTNNVLVVVGSSRSPRTIDNPWLVGERIEMIRDSIGRHNRNVHIRHARDFIYDDPQWVQRAGDVVNAVADDVNADSSRIAVIGYDKDHTSKYLQYFPQWDYIPMDKFPHEGETIDATKIRRLMFENDLGFITGVVPPEVNRHIRLFIGTDEFKDLKAEWDYDVNYKRIWGVTPFPNIFSTVDSVVIQSGHVLLVKRRNTPGRGLWAMPGGHIGEFEGLFESAIRELREETKLHVPAKVLRSKMIHDEVFSDPGRSTRGRVITHAYLFKLADDEQLPRVKGADDAVEANWFSLADFERMEPVMFEDHWHIVKRMINKLR